MGNNYRYNGQTRRISPEVYRARVNAKRRKKYKRRRIRFFISRIAFVFIFIIGVIYLISIVIDISQKPVISYQTVQRGSIDNSDVFDGLVIRDEDVVLNVKEGYMNLIAAEGDKVKKNGKVYQILDSTQSSELEETLQDIESDIEKVQEKRQGISYYQNEIRVINNNINSFVEVYHMQGKPGELEYAHELKQQLEYEISKRKNIHMKDSASELNNLKNQKQGLSDILTNATHIHTANQPGIISYNIDSHEDEFTLDNINSIGQEDIQGKYTNISTIATELLKQNEPAYRIIKDNQWKMVSFVPKMWGDKFQVGQVYNFILLEDNYDEFSLLVEDNISIDDDTNKIIFSSTEQLDLFMNKRKVSFKSTEYKYDGLKIPMSAVVERNSIKIPVDYIISSDEGTGVTKVDEDSGESRFVNLNIQYQDDEFAYINQDIGQNPDIKLNDTIIQPSNSDNRYVISEVSSSQGVYVVNGRITKFKPVEIMAENSEYAIVKSSSINGLKQFDQIITNPKNVGEEELLRNMDIKNNIISKDV